MSIRVVNQNVGQKAEPVGPIRDRRLTREAVPDEWEYPIFDAENFIIEGPASVEIVDRTGQQIQMDAVATALERFLESDREPGIISVKHDDVPVGIPIWEWESDDGRHYETTVDDQEFTLVANIGNETTKSKLARLRCLNDDYGGYSVTVYSNQEHQAPDGTRVTVDCDLHAVTLGSAEKVMNPAADFDVVDFKHGGLLEATIRRRLQRRNSLAGQIEQKLDLDGDWAYASGEAWGAYFEAEDRDQDPVDVQIDALHENVHELMGERLLDREGGLAELEMAIVEQLTK
ncbi:hypothetical protein [Natrarchaeobius oligotrophus]|uniref:hypothetical protein n=1 Tax=Natrarchaeobius oligotrophus TaxID=3455743 RepID=UPI001A9CBDBE|nr:hypothetical protein [Natrarchaeobius chitinivorans]